MKLFPVFNLHEPSEIRREGRSLPDWYIRAILGNPKSGDVAKANAAYTAQLLEAEREEMSRG